MQATPQGFKPVAEFDTKDGVYDCAWSEVRLQTSAATLFRLYTTLSPCHYCLLEIQHKLARYTALTSDASDSFLPCVHQEIENILASSCGDGSIKVWDVAAPPHANPLRSFQEHEREACPYHLSLCVQAHQP